MIVRKFSCRTVLEAAALLCVVGFAAGEPAGDEEDQEPAAEQIAFLRRLAPILNQPTYPGHPQMREQLAQRLEGRIGEVNRTCVLTLAQQQKLAVAGRMEIKRLFDRIDEAQRRYEMDRHQPGGGMQVLAELQPLRLAFTDRAFLEGTLFHKVTLSTLTEEQRTRYEQQLALRFRMRREAMKAGFVEMLDRRGSLGVDQRDRLEALLETLPLVNSGYYEGQAFWYLAAQVPEEKYREILNDDQWRLLEVRFARMQNLEPMLRQAGALAEDAEFVERP